MPKIINGALRRMLFDYIMVQSEITLSIAVIGTLLVRDADNMNQKLYEYHQKKQQKYT